MGGGDTAKDPSGKGDAATPHKYAGVVHPNLIYSRNPLHSASSPISLGKETIYFNRIQLLRLLLIRCNAFTMLKLYKQALVDATAAVEVSEGKSAQAYLHLGREYRRFLRIPEAVAAFDAAEGILRAIHLADLAGHPTITEDILPEPQSDADFWAQRGFRECDVQKLHLRREQFEASSFSTTGISVGVGVSRAGNTLDSAQEKDHNGERDSNGEKDDDEETDAGAPEEEADTRCLRLFGMTAGELAGWRHHAREARSVMAVQGHHALALPMHHAILTLLTRRIAEVRGGLLISIENALTIPLGLVGSLAPDWGFYVDFDFPTGIRHGHCGLAMLQPRHWGGYSGCVIYALGETLCCFFYFERTIMGAIKFGVHFHEVLTDVLRQALRQKANSTAVGAAFSSPGHVIANGQLNHSPAGSNELHTPTLKGSVLMNSATAHANRLVALNTLQTPPSTTWEAVHTTSLPDGRLVKASAFLHGAQTVYFALSEIPPVRLSAVEMLPALEYAGPLVLKKLSVVSKRYRAMVNYLPPPMFFGGERHAYPDYCTMGDGLSSPWVFRGGRAMTWRILLEATTPDHEEFRVVAGKANLEGAPRAILCIVTSAPMKVSGMVYYGDCRCPLLAIRESRMPFRSTLYFTTPNARGFANCRVDPRQHFTLSLTAGGLEEVLYCAHPHSDERGEGEVKGGEMGGGRGGVIRITQGSTGEDTGPSSDPNLLSNFVSRTYMKQFLFKRPARAGENNAGDAINGSATAAKLRIFPVGCCPLKKRTVMGEITFMPGADTLLLTAMAFCMIRW
ncbi:unnamed protein product [Phytomonas sp. Hart1]|nr:unnamed protein product [Phytomonas sp. Hart1]|eukprot:CCW70897.1 unnamed protein product [Phytomonas sp. isolate Hart1]